MDSGCDTDEAAQVQLRSSERKQTLLLSRQEAGRVAIDCGNKDTEKSKEISLQPATDKGEFGVTTREQVCLLIKQCPLTSVGVGNIALITRLTQPLNVSVNIGPGGLRRNSSGYYSSEQRSNPTTPGTSKAAFSVYKLPEFNHVKSKIDTGLYLSSHGLSFNFSM